SAGVGWLGPIFAAERGEDPNVVGEVRAAYQSTVPGSASASGSAPVNRAARSSAFSGLASMRATNAYGVSIVPPSRFRAYSVFAKTVPLHRNSHWAQSSSD